jgi:hypothetical protein
MNTHSTDNTPVQHLGPITFWGWSTQHNLTATTDDDRGDGDDDGTTPPLSVRNQILAILRDYNWVDIADIMAVSSFWPSPLPPEQTCPTENDLGLVSCTNHPGHAHEPKLRFSHAGMRTDKVRKIYIVDDDYPLPRGSQSWSLRSGCGATNEEEIIYRYLKEGVDTGPGGPCRTAHHLRQLAATTCKNGTEGYTRLEISHPNDDECQWPGHWLVYLANQELLDEEFDDETKTIIDEGFIPAAQAFWVPDPKHCTSESDCACLLCCPYRD